MASILLQKPLVKYEFLNIGLSLVGYLYKYPQRACSGLPIKRIIKADMLPLNWDICPVVYFNCETVPVV